MARSTFINEDVVCEAEAAARDALQNITKAKRMILDLMENYYDYLFDENDGVEKRRKAHEEKTIKINIAFDYINACENELEKIENFAIMLGK